MPITGLTRLSAWAVEMRLHCERLLQISTTFAIQLRWPIW